MKTVVHHNKIYQIDNDSYHALINYQNGVNALPKEERKGSLAKTMLDECKKQVFRNAEFTEINLII